MKKFIVYLSNGKIIRTGNCPSSDFYLQGEHVIEGIANDALQYIQEGEVIDMPPKPGEFYAFDYDNKQWIADTASADIAAKAQRNALLLASDWTQLADIPLNTKQIWIEYRQQLRDITTQPNYPFEIIWPTPPQ
jgi:hypothetical protein